ncbi:MAG: SDR family oxidoreductase [Bacteroides sp.]|nr:SDR family oxidoreductase [Bacteroides sp.]
MPKEKNTRLTDPMKKYPHTEFPMQKQQAPGLQSHMRPVPDSGEKTYQGHGRLQGRRALITGGDSGIGRAVAIAYAREGAEITITYLPQENEDALSLATLLQEEGHTIHLMPVDLRQEEACKQVIDFAIDHMGGLDLLVCNAGVQTAQEDIADLTARQIQSTFEVNVFSVMYLCKAAVPHLPPGSSVIVTASAEYYTPNKVLLDYAASKSAVVGFGLALSKQVIDKGIRVNVVCPGPVWTPLEVSGGNPDAQIPRHGLDIPMKRPAQPVEMAGVYVFLASEEASYVMGEVYGLTGGLSSR